MNKIQKVGLAIAIVVGSSFAQGSLWGVSSEFPSLQVLNDDVKACWAANPPGSTGEYGSKCYDGSGGWWFGYRNKKGASMAPDEGVQVKVNGEWVDWNANAVELASEADGNFNIEAALQVKISVTTEEGDPGAGIGFNHKQDEQSARWDNSPTNTIDISDKGGYCITYSLTGKAMQFVLGWDETPGILDDKVNNVWNVYAATLAESTTPRVLDLPFDAATFKNQGNWGVPAVLPLSKALQEAVSVKIRYDKEGVGSIDIYQLGWKGECTLPGDIVPIAKGVNVTSGVNFSLANKVLSLAVERSAFVQIINLQGAVVYSQALVPNKTENRINLGSLPAGVYMVRVPALGYVNRIMVK